MQALDAVTLKHLAAELDDWLATDGTAPGAKVSKVQHPSRDEFLVTFWGGKPRPDNLNLLYINLSPEFSFCCLLDAKSKHDFIRQDFEKPTSFCMLLRKHLSGANVLSVSTLPGERVINLRFESFNELGNKVRLVLSLELMGKHTNMILYDDVQEIILGVAHGVSEKMSQYRELSAGLTYAPPPEPMGKRFLSQVTPEAFAALLSDVPQEQWPQRISEQFYGWGRQPLTDALSHTTDAGALYQLLLDLESGQNLRPTIDWSHDRFSLLPPAPSETKNAGREEQPSIQTLLMRYFTGRVRSRRLSQLRQRLLQAVQQQEKRRQKRTQELTPVDESEIRKLQGLGDRLLAAHSAGELLASPESTCVNLPDWETGENLGIEIDPSIGWVENAQLYYRRAKKARARKEAYQEMQARLEGEKAYHGELLCMIEQAETLAELDMLEVELIDAGLLKPRSSAMRSKRGKKEPLQEMAGLACWTSSDGMALWVGKSGEGNAKLVGKLARPDDVWLHVHQVPGSHVLIRTDRQPVPDQTLLEAANLAVYFSSARQSVNVPVNYTESRYVRKIPGSYPGHVNYRNEQTVFITPDSSILSRFIPELSAVQTV